MFEGQTIHEKIISETEGIKTKYITRLSTSREIQGTRRGIYIDDFFAIGAKVAEVCGVVNEAFQEYERSGFVVAEQKKELPPKSMMKILGIEVHENGLLVPKRDSMWNLLIGTETMIHAKRWSKARLSEVLGKLVWYLLLRRPLLSTKKDVYKMLHSGKYRFIPSFAARCALTCLVCLALLLEGNIRR